MLMRPAPRRRASCRVSPLGLDLRAARRAARRARACRSARSRRRALSAGSKPCPSSSITAATAARLPREQDADVPRARVLDDVRERLLHDPVERGLDLGRKALVRERRLEVDRDPGLLARTSSVSRSSAAHEAEVVERLRPKLDGEPAHVLQRRDDQLAQLDAAAARESASSSFSSSDLRPSRIEVSACPVSSCSSRARRRRSSSCASTTRRSASRAMRSERSTATAAREAKVSARRRSLSVKRASLPSLSCSCDHADRAAADEQRHPKPRAAPDQARDLVVHLGIVEQRVAPLALAALEHAPALRCRPRNRLRRGSASPPSPATAAKRSSSAAAREEHGDERARRAARAAAARSGRAAGRGRSRCRARCRPRSATRAAATTASPPRRGVRSRSRPPPGSRAAPRAPGLPR